MKSGTLKAIFPATLRPFLRPTARFVPQTYARAAAWARFWRSVFAYRRLGGTVPMQYLQPCPGEDGIMPIEPTYFYQDNWAFELIVNAKPAHHVDIGSHNKFVALLSKVIPTETVDVRAWPLTIPSLKFRLGSILALPYPDASLLSVSSLCVVEHIGLGRYGDPLDPMGTEKAVAELKRVLAPEGDLYISVPIDDTTRTYFNAHRAFAIADFESMIHPLQIVSRAFIHGETFSDTPQSGFGTACYHLRKAAAVE
ncbi:MAG TPA: DUF268 domain-containing protein [Rhizomicrobium sp.]|nr:DUF268 domain-containing protein [Rhizomicrobium sp.]